MGDKQHTTPCAHCPWRRDNQAPGWLGASTPGEFLRTSDSGVRMPCHVHVDYDANDWREQADRAPQCAGRSVHLANRSMRVGGEVLNLPADHGLVFSRPHEFIEHHTGSEKDSLVSTIIYELYLK